MGRQTLVAVAVAALLITSGCSSLNVLAEDTPSPPDADVAQRYESLDTLEAIRVTTVDTANDTNETRERVRADFSDDRPRRSHQVLAPESRESDITAVNESGVVVYDADENTVTRIPRTVGQYDGNRSTYLASVVDAARNDDITEFSDGVSPLPVVPATESGPSIPEDAIEGFEVEYLGTQTVAGRTAHGFELTAVSEAALTANRTLWLDSEYFYPLKTRQRLSYGNRTIEMTSRLETVTFGADLPTDAFDFDVPEDATVETWGLPPETFDSPAELRERVNFSIPHPRVPENYAFDKAQYIGGNAAQASLHYVDTDGDRLTVTKMAGTANGSGGFTPGERVTVADHEGRYVTTSRVSIASWSCEDVRYSVVATDLRKASLLTIADSVGCE
jgi:outer membrane lipoprotein-sorting protein